MAGSDWVFYKILANVVMFFLLCSEENMNTTYTGYITAYVFLRLSHPLNQ